MTHIYFNTEKQIQEERKEISKFKAMTRIVSITLLVLITIGLSQNLNSVSNYLAQEIMTDIDTIEVDYVDEIGNLI